MKALYVIYMISFTFLIDFPDALAQKKEVLPMDFYASRILDCNNIIMKLNNVGNFSGTAKWDQMNNTYFGNTIVYDQGPGVWGKSIMRFISPVPSGYLTFRRVRFFRKGPPCWSVLRIHCSTGFTK